MQNIDGNIGFVGTESRMYRMRQGRNQLLNLQGSCQKSSLVKNIEINKNGYIFTVEVETTVNASQTNKLYTNISFSLPLQKVKGKTITIQYDSWQSNVPGENAILGTVCVVDGKNSYSMLYFSEKNKELTVSIPNEATKATFRILIIENSAASIPVGKYTATFKGIMASIGKTRKKWEPYKE